MIINKQFGFYLLGVLNVTSLIIIYKLMVPNNLTLIHINNVNIFSQELNAFKSIIEKECDAKNILLGQKCLEKLKNFDAHLISQSNTKLNMTEGCDKCLILMDKNGNPIKEAKVYYHTFWNLKETPHLSTLRMINLNVMSYLATQNLCCSKMIIWTLQDSIQSLENLFNKKYSFFIKSGLIEIKLFLINDFCMHGFFKEAICSQKSHLSISQFYMVSVSDLIRFAVLHRYGGIWTDGDTIYLKDMRFLWHFNFSYRWSGTQLYNTAIIGLNKNVDSSISQLVDSINTKQSDIGQL